jgi:glucosamine--fructose-6-phosphate aminotransferase (isomerizing)
MCGIVGYIGHRQAYDILIKGLKRLEYRGYDSAGIALSDSDYRVYKCKGKVSDLEEQTKGKNIVGNIGMGHTRWATHGEPNDSNAHPHKSMNGKFVIIHNGIIENYGKLKQGLEKEGYIFESETDTEVLANLIEFYYINNRKNGDSFTPEDAVRAALNMVEGAYGLVILCEDNPGQMIAARKGSPLVIGIGKDEYFIASDATPIIEYTNSVIYLNDDDIAVIDDKGLILKTFPKNRLSIK